MNRITLKNCVFRNFIVINLLYNQTLFKIEELRMIIEEQVFVGKITAFYLIEAPPSLSP